MGTLWQHRMLLLNARNSPSQERPCRVRVTTVTKGEAVKGVQPARGCRVGLGSGAGGSGDSLVRSAGGPHAAALG